jgi:diacylglycerol kinase
MTAAATERDFRNAYIVLGVYYIIVAVVCLYWTILTGNRLLPITIIVCIILELLNTYMLTTFPHSEEFR